MDAHYSFYKLIYPPQKWSLSDVLYWVSMSELPEAYYANVAFEGRESLEVFQENIFEMGKFFGDVIFDSETTERIGLRTDPRWQKIQFGPKDNGSFASAKVHEQLATLHFDDDPEETQRNRLEQLDLAKRARVYEEDVANWELEFSDFLDRYKSMLIVNLREGNLAGEGIKVAGKLDGEYNEEISENLYQLTSNQSEFEGAFSSIPQKLWVTRRVDWDGAYLEGDDEVFLGVRFDMDEILKIYPPKPTSTLTLDVCGDALMLSNSKRDFQRRSVKQGRPSKNWEAINIRIAEIIQNEGGLPRKQDALAQDLVDWYQAKFRQNIGLSTVKARLKGYYSASTLQKSEK